MKVSVITACYNSEKTIEDTIRSVLAQTYKDIDYIVVDGASTDGTLDVIRQFRDDISSFISEPDKGIYDALNKGINLAAGEVIGILHSDDLYASNRTLEMIVDRLQATSADAVYGDLNYVEKSNTGKVFRHWKAGDYSHGMFLKGWMPPHPAFYVRKEVYKTHGLYNTGFQLAADYEFMLRVIHKHKINIAYLPEVLVNMRVGGESNISIKNRLLANREDRKAWKVNGLKPGAFTTVLKPLSKLNQFLKK